jgi:predicted XRE-type DNA-binding protein
MARKRSGQVKKNAAKKTRGSPLRADSIPRALLAREVRRRMEQFGLTRMQAAAMVGDAATQMSRLMTGYVNEFSADRLVKMLLRLGSDVEIVVRHGRGLGRRGKVMFKAQKKRA